MPDLRRHPIIAPVLAALLVAMLGSTGLACACALAALDTPATMDHAKSGDHADTAGTGEHDCDSPCRHAVGAAAGKTSDASDHRTEKPLLPATHYFETGEAFVPGLPALWQYEKRHPALPLSTPVSRSDTLLD